MIQPEPMSKAGVSKLGWGVIAYTLAVIVWGAYVRASGSGAGCGAHWPLCNGTVMQRSPQLQTVIEFSHRLTSGLSLVLILGLAVAVFRNLKKPHLARRAAVASVIFILTEALIGAGLVLLGLVAKDQSALRAWSLALHLANTFVLLACLASTAFWAGRESPRLRRLPLSFRLCTYAALGLTVFVGMSGAVTALGDTLFPSTSTVLDSVHSDFSATSHWLIRLRIWHPMLAVSTSLFLFVFSRLAVNQWTDPRSPETATRVRRSALALAIGLFAQMSLGLVNVAFLAPVPLQLAHLVMADLVWLLLMMLILETATEAQTTTEPQS